MQLPLRKALRRRLVAIISSDDRHSGQSGDQEIAPAACQPPVAARRRHRGGGLALPGRFGRATGAPNLTAAPDEHIFNAFLKIGDDGHIAVIVPQCEMGQGVTTLLLQIIADELGADWRTIVGSSALISPLYTNTLLVDEDSATFMPRALALHVVDVRSWVHANAAVRWRGDADRKQSSVRMFEVSDAAAQACTLLMMAAAKRWTPIGRIATRRTASSPGRTASCASATSRRWRRRSDLLAEPVYRANNNDLLYGKELTRLDLPAKVDGSATRLGDIRSTTWSGYDTPRTVRRHPAQEHRPQGGMALPSACST